MKNKKELKISTIIAFVSISVVIALSTILVKNHKEKTSLERDEVYRKDRIQLLKLYSSKEYMNRCNSVKATKHVFNNLKDYENWSKNVDDENTFWIEFIEKNENILFLVFDKVRCKVSYVHVEYSSALKDFLNH